MTADAGTDGVSQPTGCGCNVAPAWMIFAVPLVLLRRRSRR
jgi:hypothetical protein